MLNSLLSYSHAVKVIYMYIKPHRLPLENNSIKFIIIIYHLINIYTELVPKLSATASVAQW